MTVLASANFSVGEFLLWCLYVFLFVVWLWLLITIFADLFRRHDISGWVKALWIIFLIAFNIIAILVYLVTQSKGMAERQTKQTQAEREQLRQMIGTSPADELAKLDQLRQSGSISEDEYQKLRARVMA